MEEEKKKARGYWLRLAEKQRKQEEIKCEVKKPPNSTSLEQAHCKGLCSESIEIPCTPVQPRTRGLIILEVSNLI